MPRRDLAALFSGQMLLFLASGAVSLAQDERVDFASDVAPILRNRCLECHGPEETKGDLRLDSRAAALKGGSSGAVIVPGNSDDSYLIVLVEDGEMPPKGDPLTAGEIATLRKWIDQGAEWSSAAASTAGAEEATPDRPKPATSSDADGSEETAPLPAPDPAAEEGLGQGLGPEGTLIPSPILDVAGLVDPSEGAVDFRRDILPLFQSKCLRCHGQERPKSRFRLDNRESALEGGSQGIAILPGNSAESPLIHFVSHMVEGMEMPPAGEGESLTGEEIARLRAWIDQGAPWDEGDQRSGLALEWAPALQWTGVDGSEQKFRELTGMPEGWSGGIERLTLEHWLDRDTKLTIDGRGIAGPQDYRLWFELTRQDWGFLRGGFRHFRTYYNNYGGYYAPFDPSIAGTAPGESAAAYQLDRDLHLDVGHFWTEAGITLPNWPLVTLGYEYRFKDGTKSILHWGPSTVNGETRSIYPAYKDIDERIHTIRAAVDYEIAGFSFENHLMVEYLDRETKRHETTSLNFDAAPTNFTTIREEQDSVQWANTLSVQKRLGKWLLLTGGYYYSHLDADAAFDQSSFNASGEPVFDQQWFARPIVLDWDSHVFNLSSQVGPWNGLTFSAGVQSDWQSLDAVGRSTLFFGLPDPTMDIDPFFMSTVGSSQDRARTTEHATLRYDGLPRTVLFAEAELEQETTDYFEEDPGALGNFLRDSEMRSDEEDYRVGFTLSPWNRVSLTTHYRNRRKDTSYDHQRDEFSFEDFDGNTIILPDLGYPGFILSRDWETHEGKVRLSVRPASWMRAQLSYQLQTSDYETVTASNFDEFSGGGAGLPPEPLPTDTVGGRLLAGEYDTQIASLNVVLTPWKRLSLNGSLSFQDVHSRTENNGDPAVADYDGTIYSLTVGGTFLLDKRTTLSAYYTYSQGDFSQDGFYRDSSGQPQTLSGLPLGIEYDQHSLQAGISRQFNDKLEASLQFRYFRYQEPTSSGINDFDAHGVYLSLACRWY
ncbi:MAG TPA: c-type cytochrome domain-containing protein [Verrucomicrobiales bacterium]|nr:c-type cytochrome domain-containing protein [Verrucomicrobiales bacterium]